MSHEIKVEVQTLFDAVERLLENDALEGFTKPLPLYSNALSPEEIEEIRLALQERLPSISRGSIAVVTQGRSQTKDQAGELLVHFLRRYSAEETSQGWFVDSVGESCWYFKTADEKSAHALERFFNQPENRRKLEALRFEVGVEVASLTLWLNTLRDAHIDVRKFGYKSTGQLHIVDSEMRDLCK